MFSDKLGGFEAKVNPELWTNIASQIGTTAATTASVGMSLVTKIIIGVSAASVITVTALLITNSEEAPKKSEPEKEQVSETFPITYTTSKEIVLDQTTPLSKNISNDGVVDVQSNELNTPTETEIVDSKVPESISNDDLQKAIIRLNTVLVDTKPNPSEEVKEDKKETSQGMLIEPEENLTQEDQVEVPEQVKQEERLDIILPNVFTPNGDYANDELMMEVPENVTDFQITILNTSGKVVYQSDNPNFRWSGRHYLSGDKVTAGQYVYFVILKVGENDPIEKSSYLKISY